MNKYISRFYLTIISKEFIYCCHLGVLKNFQKGIFNSSTGTFLKNVINASISLCVSAFASSSKQPKRTSNAIRAIAINQRRQKNYYSFTYIYAKIIHSFTYIYANLYKICEISITGYKT